MSVLLTVCRCHQELVKEDGQPGTKTPVLSFDFNLLSCVSTEQTTLSGNFCWSAHTQPLLRRLSLRTLQEYSVDHTLVCISSSVLLVAGSAAYLESTESPLKSAFLFLLPHSHLPRGACGFVMVGIPINVRSVLGTVVTAINHPGMICCLSAER